MAAAREKQDRVRRTAMVALAAPACRMLVVEGWADEDGGGSGHNIHPVLALQTLVRRNYARHRASGPTFGEGEGPAALERGLLDAGWRFTGEYTDTQPLVLDGDFGVMPLDELEAINPSCRAVVADWPREEDDARLTQIIAEVVEDAEKRARQKKAERQGAKS